MRKILPVLMLGILICSFGFDQGKDSYQTKPIIYPTKTIEAIQDQFAKINLLDTVKVLDADYRKIFEQMPNNESQFQAVHQKEIALYIDFVHVKSVLVILDEIENEKDNEIKENLLFKVKVKIKNNPVSMQDLKFTYSNWDIIQ